MIVKPARPISLDDLPKLSPWPARLLGGAHFAAKQRTSEEVLREYDREKWGSVLAGLRAQGDLSVEALYQLQGVDPRKEIAFSRGNELHAASALQVLDEYLGLLSAKIAEFNPRVLVELGSGLGDKLLALAAKLAPERVYGGEFTASGVECGRLLAAKRGVKVDFEHFDYTNPETLLGAPRNAVIYTSHSVEQIPSLSESFIQGVIDKMPQAVIHFEPCYEAHDDTTLLGQMRRRYAEVNDYNRNLLGLLRSFEQRGRIRILDLQADVFGIMPLNATSIIVWQPV